MAVLVRRCALVVLLALVAISVGSARASIVAVRTEGKPAREARAFAIRVMWLLGDNRYADAWLSLHPLHQQAAPLARYVECENLAPIPGRVRSVRALRTWSALTNVAGLVDPVQGIRVTLRIVISDPSIPMRTAVVMTIAVVRVEARWAWMLPSARYAAYAAGQCPASG